jgi:hypothetical protein
MWQRFCPRLLPLKVKALRGCGKSPYLSKKTRG